jgi:hypothetical protein
VNWLGTKWEYTGTSEQRQTSGGLGSVGGCSLPGLRRGSGRTHQQVGPRRVQPPSLAGLFRQTGGKFGIGPKFERCHQQVGLEISRAWLLDALCTF